MSDDYFEISFSVAGISYEGEVWPDADANDNIFCQLTYHKTTEPDQPLIIYIENNEGTWKQKIIEDGEKMVSPEFIAEVNKQLDANGRIFL